MIYDKEYFINKFEAIPEREIGQGDLQCTCALWHCGVREVVDNEYVATPEATALALLLSGSDDLDAIWKVNDRGNESPKNNLLNALKAL